MKNISRKIKQIIKEEISMLLEREAKSSVNSQIVISFAAKYNFLLPYELSNTDVKKLTFYYNEKDSGRNLQRDLDNLNELLMKCGWVITQYGGYYNGLRNLYTRYQENHPEFGKGTFFVITEAEYGTRMDDYFGNDKNVLANNHEYVENEKYWDKGFNFNDQSHLGVTYERGIFYHLTNRKNLDSILRHGLKPKNGGGITRWRSTTPRIYLSLLPNFDDIEYLDDEEYEDDTVLLRINLKPVMKNFDFYVDYEYNNAVYTYSNIPPNFIEVVSNEEIRDFHSDYFLRYATRNALRQIVEKNFSEYDEEEKKDKVDEYYFQICDKLMPNLVSRYLKGHHISEKYMKYMERYIREEIDDYLNS